MSSLNISCPHCGAAHDPDSDYCHQCGKSLTRTRKPTRRRHPEKSRRAAILKIMGISSLGMVTLPVAYFIYQRVTDPHILTYMGHSSTTIDAAWSPDGTKIASSGWLDGGTVQVWNALTGELLHICKVEQPLQGIYPLDVVWSSDGHSILAFVGGNYNTRIMKPGSRIVEMVQVWNAVTGQRVHRIPVIEPVIANALGTGTDQPMIRLWALNLHYLATTKRAYDALPNDILEIWDITTGSKIITSMSTKSQIALHQVIDIIWAHDAEKLAIYWSFRDTEQEKPYETIEIWNSTTNSTHTILNTKGQSQVLGIAWAPDSKKLVIAFQYGSRQIIYEIWDALAGMKLYSFQARASQGFVVAWSPDGRFLALGADVYSTETGNKITTYIVQGMLNSLAWSPDGKRVALIASIKRGGGFSPVSGTLFVLDALSGKQIAKYPDRGWFGNGGTIRKLFWSPDGKHIMVLGQFVDIWLAP